MAFLISCGWKHRPLDEVGGDVPNAGTPNVPTEQGGTPDPTDPGSVAANPGPVAANPTDPSHAFPGPGPAPYTPPTTGPNTPNNPADVPRAETPPPADDTPPGPAVSFEKDVRPILQNYCVSCHDPDPSVATNPLAAAAQDIDWLDYGTAINYKDKLLSRVSIAKDMPLANTPGRDGQTMSEEERDLIGLWIESI